MADEKGDEKKLHVDAGWKEQVRREKEHLAEDKGKPSPSDAGQAVAGQGRRPAAEGDEEAKGRGPLPPASFEVLVHTLATQALLFLTPQEDPETGKPMQNLELAKHSIDLLGVLDEKTRGNLTEEERGLLDAVLYQIRMAYVQAAR